MLVRAKAWVCAIVASAALVLVACGGGSQDVKDEGGGTTGGGAANVSAPGKQEYHGVWKSVDGEEELKIEGSSFYHAYIFNGAKREVFGTIKESDAAKDQITVEYTKILQAGKRDEFTPGLRYVTYERAGGQIRVYVRRYSYAPRSMLESRAWLLKQEPKAPASTAEPTTEG